MARLSVKYPIGSRVNLSLGDVQGRITAIYIRGRSRAYEFSYIDNNGNPTSVNVEEVEIESSHNDSPMGFKPTGGVGEAR